MDHTTSSSAPGVEVLQHVPSLPLLEREGPDAYTDLAASESSAPAPIVCGVWRHDDVEGGEQVHEAEYDEMKYILTGESVWEDVRTGKQFHAKSGSMIWLPKGSRTKLVTSKSLAAVYVESTYRKATLPRPAISLAGTSVGAVKRAT